MNGAGESAYTWTTVAADGTSIVGEHRDPAVATVSYAPTCCLAGLSAAGWAASGMPWAHTQSQISHSAALYCMSAPNPPPPATSAGEPDQPSITQFVVKDGTMETVTFAWSMANTWTALATDGYSYTIGNVLDVSEGPYTGTLSSPQAFDVTVTGSGKE